jgi:UDP-N-acetylmuramoyl-L-alanyl-D-glutamate--2,6-diaminopimelate ligase
MWQFAQNNSVPGGSLSQTTGPSSSSSPPVQSSSVAMGDFARSGGLCLDEFFAESLLFSGSNHTTAPAESQGRVVATSCTSDWNQLQPGDIYVAVDDERGDGHDKACEASRRGAKAVVCERPVPVFNVPTYLVQDSRVALGRLCHALVDHPTRSLPTVGVTGTQGKTTVIALLESIFAVAGRHAGSLSDLGCYDGMSHSASLGPRPNSTVFASRLARMSAAGCSHALVEISSRSLAQAALAGMQLDAVCVTNITSGHLDLHHSTQNYRDAKRRILDYLSPTGVVVLCADDPGCLSWLDSLEGPVLTYGLGTQAEISGSIIEQNSGEQLFVISAGSESVAVRTTIVGEHHVTNCLGAAATAFSYGIDLSTIARGIEKVDWLPGRMERVDCGQGFPVFVDVAHTPDALRASLRTARQLSRGRVICVLDEQSCCSPRESKQVHHIVQHMADVTIVVQDPMAAAPTGSYEEETGLLQVACDRSEAIAYAVGLAEPGDVVVITGSQAGPLGCFGQESHWGCGKEVVDDVEVARQLLYSRYKAEDRLAA